MTTTNTHNENKPEVRLLPAPEGSLALSEAERTLAIQKLNDLARTAMGVGSKAVITRGLHEMLEPWQQSALREKVETFDTWTKGDDP